ncbi:MAG: hypothetical protein U5O39_05390 [Gammaproteobacteria bacterium]|nr:hypothetical protein [Gammaproteobacteria bacterium]
MLATIEPTHLAYLDAVKLRADWRIKATAPGTQPGMAREAIRVIDEAIALYEDPNLYRMRLAASFVADDALRVIETARRLIYIFDSEISRAEEGQIEPDSASLRAKLEQIQAVRGVLENFTDDERIPSYKTDQFEEATEKLTNRLESMLSSQGQHP